MSRPDKARRLQEGIFRTRRTCPEDRPQALLVLLQGHDRHDMCRVLIHDGGSGKTYGPGSASAPTRQGRREGNFGDTEHFHQGSGVGLVAISHLRAGIISKTVNLPYRQAGILAGLQNGLTDHVIYCAGMALAADIIVCRSDTHDGAFILIHPDQ